jgi:hypothetical protein
MLNAKTLLKVRDTLDATTPIAGNDIEQEAYKYAKDALQRPDLAEKVIWAAARHVTRVIQEDRPGFQAVDQPKPKD